MSLPGSHDRAAPPAAERLLADAAEAASGLRARLGAAIVDLSLPDHARLSDADRASATRLLNGLVGAAEEEVRRALVPAFPERAELGAAPPIALPLLTRAGLLRDPELVAIVLRRAAEHRLTRALADSLPRRAAIDGEPPLLDALIADADGAVAGDAMALLVAQSRRLDCFAEPLLARTDLPAELQHRLVWRIAAALRTHLLEARVEPARADRALAAAASTALAGYDEAETLEGRAATLARRLDRHGRLDDTLIARGVEDGSLPLATAAIAARAGLAPAAAWDMIADPEGSRLLVLLRAIGMGRPSAARVALAMALAADPHDDGEAVAGRIEDYEALPAERAREAIRPWRLDAAYANAIAEVQAGLGTREAQG